MLYDSTGHKFKAAAEYEAEIAHYKHLAASSVLKELYDAATIGGSNKELLTASDFYSQAIQSKAMWRSSSTSSGDEIISTVMDNYVSAACSTGYAHHIVSHNEADSKRAKEYLDLWAKSVNRGIVDCVPGMDNILDQIYREYWRSGLVVLQYVMGDFKFKQKTYRVPVQMALIDPCNVYIKRSLEFGGNKYYFRVPERSISTSLYRKMKLTRFKDVETNKTYLLGRELTFGKNQGILVLKRGVQSYEGFPKPFLLQRNAYMLIQIKTALRKGDYRMAISLINAILMMKRGSKELTERGFVVGEKNFSAIRTILQNRLGGSNTLLTGYDTTAEWVMPDVAKIMTETKFSELNTAILRSLGLVLIDARAMGSKRAEGFVNPLMMLEEITSAQKNVKRFYEGLLFSLVTPDLHLANTSISMYQTPNAMWLSKEVINTLKDVYGTGNIGRKTYLETVLPGANYNYEKSARAVEEREGENDIMTPRIMFNQQVTEPQNEEDKKIDENKKDVEDKKETKTKANKLSAPWERNEDLPENVKVLPQGGQTVWRKAFNSAYKEYGEDVAIKIAWSAVKKAGYKKENNNWVKAERLYTYEELKKQEALRELAHLGYKATFEEVL